MEFIDLGFDTSVKVSTIVAIMAYDPEDMDTGIANPVNDMTLVKWLVKTESMSWWFASNLTERELRNRLRKAGHTFI